jgi:hypothetical protein
MNVSGSPILKAGEVMARRWVILRQLREEPYGAVYLAQDRQLGQDVGLKFASRRQPHYEQVREALRREGALALTLHHPHILGVLHFEEGEDGCFVVQEPFPGESLLAHLSRLERYRLPHALNLLEQVANALAYAHEHHEVHRSLNPLNILLVGETVKVANFACPPEPDGEVRHLELKAYIPPEVWEGEPVTPQANVFSLGVLGFRLAAGSLPYPLTFDEPFPYRLESPPVDLEEIPLPLQNLLLQCLSLNPQDRFEDAGAFLEVLHERRETWRAPGRQKWLGWSPGGRPGQAPPAGGTAGRLVGQVWGGAKVAARRAGEGVQGLIRKLPPEKRRTWLLALGGGLLGVIILVWAGSALFRQAESPPPPPAPATSEATPPGAAVPPMSTPMESPAGPGAPTPPAVTPAAPPPPPPPAAAPAAPREERYQLTVFTYKDKKQAEALKKRLAAKNLPVRVYVREMKKQKVYVVKVAPLTGEKQAQELARRLKKELSLPQTPKPEKLNSAAAKAANRKPRP